MHRSSYYNQPHPKEDRAEPARIVETAEARIRFGYRRIHVLLRRVAAAHREVQQSVSNFGECWSMDFVADQLFTVRRIRVLTVVDNFCRENLAILADFSLRGGDVVALMQHLQSLYGTPQRIQVDYACEFISKALDMWAYENHVTLVSSRPEKSTDSQYIESFNGSFRNECLNMHWFLSHWFLSLDDREKR